jgi:aspartyl-tRNA(Asn)/glutamyl-tRNA(Gln) amidotransferase subunit A
MVETKLPDFLYGPAIGTIIAAEGSAIFEPLIESGKVNELADQKQIAAKDYLKAMRVRTLVQKELRKLLSQVDVLLAPSRFGPASKVSDPLDRRSSDRPLPKVQGLGALIPAGNLAGLPALSLPRGFADNLPVAIQLVGLPFSENTLIAVGKEFQSRADWHRPRPPV